MNLLCPNCQKMLTVPEQFAGQLMKCPLCSGTFTVPALPAGGAADLAPPPPSPPPPPQNPAPVPEPAFSPPTIPPTPATPAFTGPAEPAFATSPPPGDTKAASTQTTPTTTAGPYARTVHVAANERILRWVPLACVVLIFLLQFRPWVGVYPGGVPAVTQNAWEAAFGWTSPDPDMKGMFRILSEKDAADINESKKLPYKEISNEPGVSLLTLFYLLPFFLVTLLFTIFVAVEPRVPSSKLPPQVQQLLPWKWAIIAGLNVILLLFLGLQMMLSFSLETSVREWVNNIPRFKKAIDDETKDAKLKEAEKGNYLSQIQRTWSLRLAFLLQIISTAAAGLVYWIERRGPGKPLPCFELRW